MGLSHHSLTIKIVTLGILALVCSACAKYAELVSKDGVFYIHTTDSEVTGMEEVIWKVGPYQKQRLSRGIRVHFKFPFITSEDAKTLHEKRKADSWLVKLTRKTLVSSRVIGHFVSTFVNQSNPRKTRYQGPSGGVLRIDYAASAISMRLGALNCPSLGHRKKITEMEVLNANIQKRQTLTSIPSDSSYVSPKVEAISYHPVVINGGNQLKGDYHIELALYNQTKKLRLSNWLKVKKAASVKGTEEVVVRGCKNDYLPGKRDNSKGSKELIRDFKFGQ